MGELPPGLVRIGGTLDPDTLISAYRLGIFPWYSDPDPVLWWCPDPRMVFDGCRVTVSRSLAKRMRTAPWRYTLDTDFASVIRHCAAPRNEDGGTWITEAMRAAYTQLHTMGYAHSLEVWSGDTLVGGLYGIALGRMFFGESMFSHATDASKAALVTLATHLRAKGFTLIDGQLPNPHLERLGATEMSKDEFLSRVALEAVPPDPTGIWRLDEVE